MTLSVLCVVGWRFQVPHYPFQFVGSSYGVGQATELEGEGWELGNDGLL